MVVLRFAFSLIGSATGKQYTVRPVNSSVTILARGPVVVSVEVVVMVWWFSTVFQYWGPLRAAVVRAFPVVPPRHQ